MISDNKKISVSFSLPEWMMNEIKETAAAKDMSISEYVRHIYNDYKTRQLCDDHRPGMFVLLVDDRPYYAGDYEKCCEQRNKLGNKKTAIIYEAEFLRRK